MTTSIQLPQKKKFEFRVVYALLAVILAALLVIGYWSFVPVDVLQIKKLPVPATQPENIKSGRLIFFKFDYCKKVDVKGLVERQLISDRLVLDLPSYTDSTSVGCSKADAPIILPYTIRTQTFYVHYKVSYPVNPLRTEVEEFNTDKFNILPVTELQPAPEL